MTDFCKRTGFSHHPKNTQCIEVHYIENILSTIFNSGADKWQTVLTNNIEEHKYWLFLYKQE